MLSLIISHNQSPSLTFHFSISWKFFLRWQLGPFWGVHFSGSFPCIQEIYMLLNFFVFFFLSICILWQGGSQSRTLKNRGKLIFPSLPGQQHLLLTLAPGPTPQVQGRWGWTASDTGNFLERRCRSRSHHGRLWVQGENGLSSILGGGQDGAGLLPCPRGNPGGKMQVVSQHQVAQVNVSPEALTGRAWVKNLPLEFKTWISVLVPPFAVSVTRLRFSYLWNEGRTVLISQDIVRSKYVSKYT